MAKQHLYEHDSLFATLAEDLKAPLTRIAYRAEVAGLLQPHALEIQHIAQHTLQLLDAYLLGAKGIHAQTSLQLEPVNPSAVLVDAAYELKEYAKQFSCTVHLQSSAARSFALSHRLAMQKAVTSIGKVFIEAQNTIGAASSDITIASYKTKNGTAVGVFLPGNALALQQQLLSRASSHVGKAARPYVGFASGASAQLVVAEQLLQAMQTRLRTARRGSSTGLAFDLTVTSQLTLV